MEYSTLSSIETRRFYRDKQGERMYFAEWDSF